MLKHIFICLIFVLQVARAEVTVAFFEKYDPQGQKVQLEKGGRFFHVALRHQGQWLHADSFFGVILSNELSKEKYGEPVEFLSSAELSLDEMQIKALLGSAYDRDYLWDSRGYYCSELVAKLLSIEPVPMRFDSEYWKDRENLPRGQLGVSPDYLYQELKKRAWSSGCGPALN